MISLILSLQHETAKAVNSSGTYLNGAFPHDRDFNSSSWEWKRKGDRSDELLEEGQISTVSRNQGPVSLWLRLKGNGSVEKARVYQVKVKPWRLHIQITGYFHWQWVKYICTAVALKKNKIKEESRWCKVSCGLRIALIALFGSL